MASTGVFIFPIYLFHVPTLPWEIVTDVPWYFSLYRSKYMVRSNIAPS